MRSEEGKRKQRRYIRAYHQAHPEVKRRSKALHPDACRNAQFKHRYGITLIQRNEMYVEQSGRCAICDCQMSGRNCCVDHNHGTGRVRALLCTKCNTAIGMLLDDASIAMRLIAYLEKFK